MPMVGYGRVSKEEQKLDLQLDALKVSGCTKIFTDEISGATTDRCGLSECLEYLREGDTLTVWKLDRLGRSTKHLIELIETLKDRGIGFRSLTEGIDTSTPTGMFFFHIIGALAQLERSILITRTKAGLEAARARGRKGGRPKAISIEKFNAAYRLYQDRSMPVGDICHSLGINKRTFYNYLKVFSSSGKPA